MKTGKAELKTSENDFRRYGRVGGDDYIRLMGGALIKNSLEDDLVLFKSALRIILEHGWLQGRGGNLEDGVCFRGALQAAGQDRYDFTDKKKPFRHTFHPTTDSFLHERILPYTDIVKWNDAKGRTEAEVIALYRAVIEHIEDALGIEHEPVWASDPVASEERPKVTA
jgi:hypothetical protein